MRATPHFHFAPGWAFPANVGSHMLWVYRLLFFPTLLLLAPYYLWRMRRRGGYQENFAHRFGRIEGLPAKRPGVRRIWLQAVSVGEMLAIGPLLEALNREADVEIFLTTTTSTGYKLALERYRGSTIGIAYFPIDAWPFSRRAWQTVNPDLVILTEGERWPEHIAQAQMRGVNVLCINARLSDRSYRRMSAIRWLIRPLFRGITRLLPVSAHDEARFRELDFGTNITVTGNIKLDVTIPPLAAEERRQLRRELGLRDGFVLLGSSTWPGEEVALLEALRAARADGLDVSLLVVPRHAERRKEIEAVLKSSGLSYHFRSHGSARAPVDVAVGDTTGELRKLTQLADLVFIGKSLPPHHEGQTPIEAAALEKPILLGPVMSNFRVIASELGASGAARVVRDADELATTIVTLLRDPSQCAAMAAAARVWHRANQGAVRRTLEIIREELNRAPMAVLSDPSDPDEALAQEE